MGISTDPERPNDNPERDPLLDSAESLVAAARLGSLEALGQLLAGCQQYLLAIATRNLGDDVRAKLGASDVVQETFVQAHQIFDRFQGRTEEELLAWLACILGNKLSHMTRLYHQTKKRDVHREVFWDDVNSESRSPKHQEMSANSASQVAIRTEDALRLQRAMANLSAKQRQVISLRNWEGRSFEQVATQMNCTYEAARKLWARAVVELQRQLASGLHESQPG